MLKANYISVTMNDEHTPETWYADILSRLDEYALIRMPRGSYIVFHVPGQSWVHGERWYAELTELMVQRGVRIVDDEKELAIPGFVPKRLRWDPVEKKFIEVPRGDQ